MQFPVGGNFEKPAEGQYGGVLVRVIDQGTQEGRYGAKRKVRLDFELTTAFDEGISHQTSSGENFLVVNGYTANMNSKSNLRKFIESWGGKSMSDEQAAGFDLESLLGKPAVIGLEHDGDFANISNVSRPVPGVVIPPASIEPVAFDLSNPDWDIFESLSQRTRERIAESPEYKALKGSGHQQDVGGGSQDDTAFGDEWDQ